MAMKLINEFREKNKIVEPPKILKPPIKTSIFKTGYHVSLPINEEKEKDDNYDIAAFIASITEEAFAKEIVHSMLLIIPEFLLDSVENSES